MARVQIYPAEVRRLRVDLAYGLLNYGYRLEGALKGQAVVAGGHRSFMTGPKTKAGTPRIGGTLRRSMHAVVYLDSQPLLGAKPDENGEPTPDYAAGSGIVLFAGTNSGYGAFVDQGTSKMTARPMVIPAFLETKDEAPALIAAGVARRRGRGR